jgi:hypothetical protein
MGKLRRHLMKDFRREIHRREVEEETNRAIMEDDTGRRVVECIAALRGEKSAIRSSDNLELNLGLVLCGRADCLLETFFREAQCRSGSDSRRSVTRIKR